MRPRDGTLLRRIARLNPRLGSMVGVALVSPSLTSLHFCRFCRLDRARNREHARRSRCRKKLVIESLQQSITSFQQENERLRGAIRGRLGESAAGPLLEKCSAQATSGSAELAQLTGPQSSATQSLDDHDYGLVRAL